VTGGRADRVIVLGDIAVDVVAMMTGPLVAGTDTPTRIRYAGGGAGANVAAWLAALGVPVTLVGRVGADAVGREALAELAVAGVDLAVTVDPDAATGTVIVLVDTEAERSMLPDRGANRGLTPADLPTHLFTPGTHLHLSGYPLLDPASADAALAALELARTAGLTVSVDPASTAPLQTFGADRFRAATADAVLLLPNRAEAVLLSGQPDAASAACALAEGFRAVIVSCGGDGAVWAGADEDPGSVPAAPAEVADTTGAGDAFTAAVLAAWLQGLSLGDCAEAGVRTASLAVSAVGARPRPPTGRPDRAGLMTGR